mgnify:CR=1 FL=1
MKITSVKQGSTAEKLGVKSGDQLLRINSKRVKDEIDFRFRVTEEDLILEFRKMEMSFTKASPFTTIAWIRFWTSCERICRISL